MIVFIQERRINLRDTDLVGSLMRLTIMLIAYRLTIMIIAFAIPVWNTCISIKEFTLEPT